MKTKTLSLIVMTLVMLLNACSPFVITSSSGEQPTPVELTDSVTNGYQPVTVDNVEVEVGVGSPIPVFAHISGNLPDPCSQVEYTEIKQDGANFIISLFATPDAGGPAVDSCIKDPMPFKMSIPLSVVELPAGTYSVIVNGSRAEFELRNNITTSTLPTADMPISKADISVVDVSVEVGVGSPIPVHAVISADLPSGCAKLGEVRVHRDGTTFFVRLVAYLPAESECNPDTLPFRVEVPLNIVNLPEGSYEVNVNGVIASFDPRTAPAVADEAGTEHKLVPVENVEVQVGVGSPIPVEVVASGTWPDLCAQIAETQTRMNGFQIDVTVLASTAESCRPDNLGLPFRYAFPLNIAEMEAGTYTITVNGASTTLALPVQP